LRSLPSVVFLVVAGAAVGCSETHTGGLACPPYIAAGLSVSVANDQSNDPICDARVIARDGGYSETLVPGFACRHTGAIERAGTYSVSVERAGFAPALVSNLEVVSSAGECPHVRTVEVVIRLVPVQ
jgi:hypothetical protein